MSKIKILGNLLAAQGVLATMPTEERALEFLCQAIKYVPGISEINSIWGTKWIVSSPCLNSYCDNCQKHPIDYVYDTCILRTLPKVTSIPLRLQDKIHGVINILEDNSGDFDFFKPHVLNTVNACLILLENKQLLREKETENERHFHALVNSIPGAIYRFKNEKEWTIQFVSDDIFEISGYPASDFINGSINKLIDIVHPDDHFKLRRIISKAVDNKGAYSMDYRIFHADGSIRWVNERGQAVITENGELKFLEGGMFDITQRKKNEAQIIAAKNEAEKSNRAKTEFLASMSHELRTPLNGILGYAQILQRSEIITADQQQCVNIIRQSGEYLLTLIDDLLDLSMIESEALELNMRIFNISQLLKDTTSIFNLRAGEKGIQFLFDAKNLPETVFGDEKRLKQILINLLSNAVKFTDQGEVWLKVHFSNPFFDFEVGDTGCGIKKNDLETIFSPFQKIKHNKRSTEGTGLGLSICRKLVDMMHGQLNVKTKIGKGSVFNVRLELPPRLHENASLKNASQCVSGSSAGPLKILIVDDNINNLNMLSNLLASEGYEVHTASGGKDCLEKVESNKPDVVLMDIVMPGMDGLETTRRLRSSEYGKDLVIVALSANAFVDNKEECMTAGCNGFISKPVHLAELKSCIYNNAPQGNKTTSVKNILVDNTARQASGLSPPSSILIADDNEINRMLLKAQLKDFEESITEAKDGIEAIIWMRKQEFDLILLDLNMPGLSGQEIMRYMGENPSVVNQSTPVIAVTAYATEKELSSLVTSGFSDYLVKPVLQENMNLLLNRWIFNKP